ncbi:MAG: DUF58 domain-containing protein [Planctomycetota bacterium]
MTDQPSSGLAVVAICAGVLALGMVAGAGLWMTAAITVAAVVLLGNLVATQASSSAIAERTAPRRGQRLDLELAIGSRVEVAIDVTNHGRLPIAWLLAEDLVPAASSGRRGALEVEGARLGVFMLWPGQTKQLRYTIRCRRRGYFQIGPTVLETGDPVGLFRRYRLAARPIYMTVLPQTELVSTYDIGSRRPIGEIRIRDNVMADPTRLRGIRQWQAGDPMRSVHWAATARTGTLHSKVYEPSSIAGATLVLDFHAATNPSRHEPVRTDLAVSAAASIAATLHDAGEPFGLVTNARDAADRIRTEGFQGDHRVRDQAGAAATMKGNSDRLRPVVVPVDRGPLQLRRIRSTLARLERTGVQETNDASPDRALSLAELMIESQSQLNQETTLLFIVQNASEADIAAIIGCSRRGWAVAVIVNTFDINDYSRVAGPLIAERIMVNHLSQPQSIADVCRAHVMR